MSRSPVYSGINNGNILMYKVRRNPLNKLLTSGTSLAASTTLFNKLNSPTEQQDNDASLSSGYGGYYCDNGINIAILALTLAGLAAMFWILYTKITMLVGRKRRHAADYTSPVQTLPYTYTYIIEDTISEMFWGRLQNKHFKNISTILCETTANENHDNSFQNHLQTQSSCCIRLEQHHRALNNVKTTL